MAANSSGSDLEPVLDLRTDNVQPANDTAWKEGVSETVNAMEFESGKNGQIHSGHSSLVATALKHFNPEGINEIVDNLEKRLASVEAENVGLILKYDKKVLQLNKAENLIISIITELKAVRNALSCENNIAMNIAKSLFNAVFEKYGNIESSHGDIQYKDALEEDASNEDFSETYHELLKSLLHKDESHTSHLCKGEETYNKQLSDATCKMSVENNKFQDVVKSLKYEETPTHDDIPLNRKSKRSSRTPYARNIEGCLDQSGSSQRRRILCSISSLNKENIGSGQRSGRRRKLYQSDDSLLTVTPVIEKRKVISPHSIVRRQLKARRSSKN